MVVMLFGVDVVGASVGEFAAVSVLLVLFDCLTVCRLSADGE